MYMYIAHKIKYIIPHLFGGNYMAALISSVRETERHLL